MPGKQNWNESLWHSNNAHQTRHQNLQSSLVNVESVLWRGHMNAIGFLEFIFSFFPRLFTLFGSHLMDWRGWVASGKWSEKSNSPQMRGKKFRVWVKTESCNFQFILTDKKKTFETNFIFIFFASKIILGFSLCVLLLYYFFYLVKYQINFYTWKNYLRLFVYFLLLRIFWLRVLFFIIFLSSQISNRPSFYMIII
jgi:hypothetical protein